MSNHVAITARFGDLQLSGADACKYEMLTSMHELVQTAFDNLQQAFDRQENAQRELKQAQSTLASKQAQLERQVQQESSKLNTLLGRVRSLVQTLRYKKHQAQLHIVIAQTKAKIAPLVAKIQALQHFLDNHTHDWKPGHFQPKRYPAMRTPKPHRCEHVSVWTRDIGYTCFLAEERVSDYVPK